jgi:hypothetical protein
MRHLIFFLILLPIGCTAVPEFNYQPTRIGSGAEGYIEESNSSDGIFRIEVLSMNGHKYEALSKVVKRRAIENCKGDNFKILLITEMIDVCSEGGCFKTAVRGEYECT